MYVTPLFIFLLGLIFGSFISALSWRIPRGLDIWVDRSRCDKCKSPLYWYDNIPLLSFLILRGTCRNCGKKISVRYPLLELFTGVIFLLIYINGSSLYRSYSVLDLVYLLIISIILISIFVIDLELQIIPDNLVFFGIFIVISYLLLTSDNRFYPILFSGFISAFSILSINLLTKGKGMGLGDAKLALFGGLFFGFPNFISWIFLSFITGAVIGIFLILIGRAQFGRRIAFGPFLVISWFAVLFWGGAITPIIFPYLY